MPPCLLDLPGEVLEHIGDFLVASQLLGPPSVLLPLLSTCTRLYEQLSPHVNAHFGKRIFCQKFDHAAILRRQPMLRLTSQTFVDQLVRYCTALRIIKDGDIGIDPDDVYEALWVCFLMLLEDDGRNGRQVKWANARGFVARWLEHKLYESSQNGWPVDSNENGLALWIHWLTTTKENLEAETPQQREEFIRSILPFVIMSYRYPSIQCPPNHFHFPVNEVNVFFPTLPTSPESIQPPGHPFPYSLITAHGPYPLYLDPGKASVIHDWWGIHVPFSHVTTGLVSKLLYFSRRERYFYLPTIPANRAEAIARGWSYGATIEDIEEINSFRTTVLPPRLSYPTTYSNTTAHRDSTIRPYHSPLNPVDDAWDSARWDIDWIRWTNCCQPTVGCNAGLGHVIPFFNSRPGKAGLIEARTGRPRRECYDIGSMAGLWQGKLLVPHQGRHQQLLVSTERPQDLDENWMHMAASPVFMRLREYHCIMPYGPVPAGCAEEGLLRQRAEQPAGARRVDMMPGFDDGAQNAWFPRGSVFKKSEDSLTIFAEGHAHNYVRHTTSYPSSRTHDERTCHLCVCKAEVMARQEHLRKKSHIRQMAASHEHFFQEVGLGMTPSDSEENSWDGGPEEYILDKSQECSGVTDIVFVGETDLKHTDAWRGFTFYGRMRRYDGLIGLLRISESPDWATMFFYGYLVGSKNFVGTWRMASEEMGIPAWECAFSMSKREDD